ncbi:MAG: GNAT family N-acetyltransferase [Leptolyngbya sp. SIO1E4]|nr:GNAT family N-acetyltransferase [Leptolyngbya sp. SIO1E4]
MNIRKITVQDLDKLCHLFVEVFRQEPWNEEWKIEWVEERLKYILNSQYSESLLAENANEIVGAVLGRGMPFKGNLNFEIVELFVSPTLHNQGIGTKLLTALEQSLAQSNYYRIFLLTASGSPAESFYRKCGYVTNEQLCFMTKSL